MILSFLSYIRGINITFVSLTIKCKVEITLDMLEFWSLSPHMDVGILGKG